MVAELTPNRAKPDSNPTLLRLTCANIQGGHHSSVDPSAPTILRPLVPIPTTTLHFYQFVIELWGEKDEKTKKRPGLSPNKNICKHLLQ